MEFVNRYKEIKKISHSTSNLLVIFGRRRIGKTALILKCQNHTERKVKLYYSQAIEGSESLQVAQICQDIAPLIPEVEISSWLDFFRLLSRVTEPAILVLGEFPYLVKAQASLPSILQKFIDHNCPPNLRIILSGSSQNMMHSLFLSSKSPLYERAGEILHIQPMNYEYFCSAKNLDPMDQKNFLRYALVGGVPKYWEFIDAESSLIESADTLYFETGARLECEPDRLMKDENISGEQAKSILELVGRGVYRPSEMASRLGIKQTSLSKPLETLLHASLLTREIPFGKSTRSTKRTLYSIADPVLLFWYSVYSPHRTLWRQYDNEQKMKLIHDHASHVFEAEYRRLFYESQRYWESSCKFDCVRYADGSGKNIIISELKFRDLKKAEIESLSKQLELKFLRSKFAQNYSASFEIVDLKQGLSQFGVHESLG